MFWILLEGIALFIAVESVHLWEEEHPGASHITTLVYSL